MNRTMVELAWAAGFLEGEGYFGYTKQLILGASQVQREPLERLQRMFGGSIRLSKQPIYVWGLYGAMAPGLMMTLFPFMSPRRREQITRALTAWRAKKPACGVRSHCPAGHEYNEANTYRFTTSRGGRGRNCRACHREREQARRAA